MMSFADFSTCVSLKLSKICFETHPLFTIGESNHCEVNLLFNETINSLYCNVKMTDPVEVFIQTHIINQWIFSIPRKSKLKCFCENDMRTEEIIGEGSICIPPCCHVL